MWSALQSLLFQAACPLCNRPASGVFCRDCQGQILDCRYPDGGRHWRESLPRFVWGEYEGTLRQAITAMKFRSCPQIGDWLGQQAARSWLAHPLASRLPKPWVVPIPLHPTKERERGFNQAERIGAGFCRLTGYRLVKDGLQRRRSTQALFALAPEDRQRELERALQVHPRWMPGNSTRPPWLLIDDIFTTGATAREAQRALTTAGYHTLGIVAIAAPAWNPTPPPNHLLK